MSISFRPCYLRCLINCRIIIIIIIIIPSSVLLHGEQLEHQTVPASDVALHPLLAAGSALLLNLHNNNLGERPF